MRGIRTRVTRLAAAAIPALAIGLLVAVVASSVVSTGCVPLAPGGGGLPGGIKSGVGDPGAATGATSTASIDSGQIETSVPDQSTGGLLTPATPARLILTQDRGNHIRTLILNALRRDPRLGSEKGTLWVVEWLAVQGPWAMFQGVTSERSTPVEALLKAGGGRWHIVEMAMTNGRRVTPARYPDAPQGIFGPPTFSLAPRAKPSDQLLILTNARGNSTRSAILDSLRGEFTPQTKFSVGWLRVKGGWAYFYGKTVPYDMPIDAILKHRSWGWEVLTVQGEGDFPESIPQMYSGQAPRSIFP